MTWLGHFLVYEAIYIVTRKDLTSISLVFRVKIIINTRIALCNICYRLIYLCIPLL